MSVYSRAVADNAYTIAKLDTTITDLAGMYASVNNVSETGTAVFNSTSLSGGTGSWTFDGSSRVRWEPANPAYGTDVSLEAIFKTTSTAYGELVALDQDFMLDINATTGKLRAYFKLFGTAYTVQSPLSYNDGIWHHAVAKRSGGTIQLWVDGSLVASTSSGVPTGGNMNPGYFYVAAGGFIGTIDFAAVYSNGNHGSVSTSTTIAEHYSDFAAELNILSNRNIAANVMTSTTLMVNPAVTAIRSPNYAASPMTSSALMPDHRVSNFNPTTTLDQYLTSLNLQNYIKFETTELLNSGSAGNTSFFPVGASTVNGTGGPGGLPYIHLATEAYVTVLNGPGGSQPLWSGAITDKDFNIGFWFRTTSSAQKAVLNFRDINNDLSLAMGLVGTGDYGLELGTSLGMSTGQYNAQTYSSYADGKWHYFTTSYKSSTGQVKQYLDGTNTFTGTATGTMKTPSKLFMAGDVDIAGLYVDSTTVVGHTQITNIWNYGNQVIQASASMVNPRLVFSSYYYDKIATYNPMLNYKMDASGIPINDGTMASPIGVLGDSADIVPLQPAKNIKSYKFTDKESFYQGRIDSQAFPNDAATIIVLAKVNPTFMDDGASEVYGSRKTLFNMGLPGTGGFILGASTNKFFGYISPPDYAYETFLESAAGTMDDKWHLLALVKNGNQAKFYMDGRLIDTQSYPDATLTTGTTFIELGGNEVGFFFESPGATEKYIDHAAFMNTALTGQNIFELWQLLSIDGAMEASATLPLPVGIAGYGPRINPGVMYVSALLADPTQQDTVNQLPVPATAFGAFAHPNFAGTATVTINATALTASALFHMPQYNIGEINGADAMFASAYMPEAYVRLPGRWNAAPMIAIPATMVNPGTAFTRGGLWKATPLTAKAMAPIPPAYFLLTDDKYYNKLFSQHATYTEEASTQLGGSLQNTASSEVAKSFLKFFNDVRLPITIGSTRYLSSNLPAYVFDKPGTYSYDSNGNILAPDTTKIQLKAGGIETFTPTPILEPGYYDPFGRPAVAVTNIQFAYPEDTYHTNRGYSLEFTFNSTKSNQIIAKSDWRSYQYYQNSASTLGLYDGKLYAMTSYGNIGSTNPVLHPTNLSEISAKGLNPGYMLGNKRIDDGQWHHIVIQYGYEGRTQFWVDGDLDKQVTSPSVGVPGNDGTASLRPYIMGSNSSVSNFQSDFKTSVWSYDKEQFISFDNIALNFNAYSGSEPIKADVMTASIAYGDSKGRGNRARGLMLYFWPRDTELGYNGIYDRGYFGDEFDYDTFYPILTTEGRKELYDWDLFPVDIQGLRTSSVVKPERYKNATVNGFSDGFTDSIDDRRYLDILNDIIDIEGFDMICFRNYPDSTKERDAFFKDETVDTYFNITEKVLFEQFITNLRKAVDTGISLLVTNYQLAIDLGIIDRVESVSDLDDQDFVDEGDSNSHGNMYAYNRVLQNAGDVAGSLAGGYFTDTYKNNKQRVVNLLPGLTDEKGYFVSEAADYIALDVRKFAEPNRWWRRILRRPAGLQLNDEFLWNPKNIIPAVPVANVKAGRVITQFGLQHAKEATLVDNPYRNYATTIALSPGDSLNGRPVGGKIFVNFSEVISDKQDSTFIELISDELINLVYTDGGITIEERDYYLASEDNIDRQLANATITQAEYNYLKSWDMNGFNMLASAVSIGSGPTKTTYYTGSSGKLKTKTKTLSKRRKATDNSTGSQTWNFYKVEWGYLNPITDLRTLSMIDLGFLWLSDKSYYDGLVLRTDTGNANATFVDPRVIIDKNVTINAQSMAALAYLPDGLRGPNRLIATLPMYAEATITGYVIPYFASPLITTAFMPQNVTVSSFEYDEVVLYVYHEDPILYVREDVIK
jgi:hypothetical protein